MLKTLTQAAMLLIVVLIGQTSILAASSLPDLEMLQAQAPTFEATNTPFMPLPTNTPTVVSQVKIFERTSIIEDNPISPGALADEILLPDLRTLPPSNLNIYYYRGSGRKFIRFSVEILNGGPGILELVGHPEPGGGETLVHQQLFSEDNTLVDEIKIGEFIYHPYHNHIHLGDFALYDVWSVKDDFTPDEVVGTGGKISYCVRDMKRADFESQLRKYADIRTYTRCDAGTQGLSPGWIDIYAYYLPGQRIEITGLPNGVYAVVATVNPNKTLRETNLSNNAGITYFSLQDFKVNILERPTTQGAIDQYCGREPLSGIDRC